MIRAIFEDSDSDDRCIRFRDESAMRSNVVGGKREVYTPQF